MVSLRSLVSTRTLSLVHFRPSRSMSFVSPVIVLHTGTLSGLPLRPPRSLSLTSCLFSSAEIPAYFYKRFSIPSPISVGIQRKKVIGISYPQYILR